MSPQDHRSDTERLAVIESIVTRMDRRLFGVDESMGELGQLDFRLTKLENWRWWLIGIGVGLGVGGGVGLAKILEALNGK